ncbi:MAG: TolC family protein [Campylobacterota bacterium]|nr:TolC family protein [Campylobacterota bacterium]
MLKYLYPLLLFSPLLFGLTLQESVEIALKNNPDIKKQELNYQLSDYHAQELSAKDYGKFNAVASYTHYNLPRTLVPLTPASIFNDPAAVATTKDLMNVGLAYDVALFTGYAQKHTLEISSLQQEMAQAKLRLGREQLIYNVKTLYTNILALEAQKKHKKNIYTP